jgi:hypothetical protein
MDFHSPRIFSMKKANNSANLQLAGLLIAGHIISHLWQQEQTIDDHLCNGLQGNELCDATSNQQPLPCSCITFLK